MQDYEVPPIGWQLFIRGISQGDSIAFRSFLDTYAIRLLRSFQHVDENSPQRKAGGIESSLRGHRGGPLKMDLNCSLEFLIVLDLSSWKMRLTSIPVDGCSPYLGVTKLRCAFSHGWRTSSVL
jgi:hypothetical protein